MFFSTFSIFSILKTIYLGEEESETGETVAQEPKNLEVLLLEKNKALQVEQASLRTSKRELESKYNDKIDQSELFRLLFVLCMMILCLSV